MPLAAPVTRITLSRSRISSPQLSAISRQLFPSSFDCRLIVQLPLRETKS
jgi:hypothetical protein